MLRKVALLVLIMCSLVGCLNWGPSIVTTGESGFQFYNSGKSEEIYSASLERAFRSVIRAATTLGLQIVEVKTSGNRRIIVATDSKEEIRLSIDLESINNTKYVRVAFRTSRGSFYPDPAYTRMVMKEFEEDLKGI